MVIEVGKFAKVIKTSLAKYGVKKGQIVYVSGSGFVPSAKDPYNFRLKFIAAFVVDDHIIVDAEKKKMFYVDARTLELLADEEQERLVAIRNEDFKVDDVNPEG
jgi:hypothetical protein